MKNLFFDELSEEENNKIHEDNIKAFDETENDPEKYLNYKDKEDDIKKMPLSEKIELAEKTKDREILEILSEYDNSNIRFNIATNANTPENILDKIINKEINDKKIIESIYKRPDISVNKKTEISKILKCQDKIKGMTFIEKKYLARTTDNAQNIAILSKYENPIIHMQLILNEHTPESVINDILDNDFNDHVIAKAVLNRKDLSEEVKGKAEKICLNEKNIENDKADSNKLLFDKEKNNEEMENLFFNELSEKVFDKEENNEEVSETSELGIINNLQEIPEEKEQLNRNNLSLKILNTLNENRMYDFYKTLVNNPSTQSNTLDLLSKCEYSFIRMKVATHPNVQLTTLNELSKDRSVDVRYAVAENENTPPEILAKLAKDEDIAIRKNVASNENTTPEILDELSNDENFYVRTLVALNKNTPSEILDALSNDESFYVRAFVAENKNISQETLEKLIKDKENVVSEKAKDSLDYRKSNLTPMNKTDLGIESNSREKEDYER